MSISGISTTFPLDSMLSSLLNQLDGTQSSSTRTDSAGNSTTGTGTSAQPDTSLTGSTVAQLSTEILSLLVQMQVQQQSSGASTNGAGNAASPSTQSAASSTTTSPLQSLYDEMDANGDGTVSRTEFEGFIQSLGGTKSEADTVFAQLDQSSSGGLTEQQLAQDVQTLAPPVQPPSPKSLAAALFKGIDTNGDGTITPSELQSFVTANGGTAKESSQIFANIDSSGSGSISAGQLEQAIAAAAGSPNAADSSSTNVSATSRLSSLLARLASGTSVSTLA